MWNKHGVWCQCALVIPSIMALASTMSWQAITLPTDLYWSTILCTTTILQFVAAEHGPFGATTDTWQRLNAHRAFIIQCVITTWSMNNWAVRTHTLTFAFFCALSFFAKNYQRYILVPVFVYRLVAVFADRAVLGGSWILVLLYWLAERSSEYFFQKSIQTSTADTPIKKAYGATVATIVLESAILWSLRCRHRFPHTFRWTPVWASVLCCVIVVAWCSFNIQDTKVSRNAIITQRGHNMAASLRAAKACPICQKCLTALDMESSFND